MMSTLLATLLGLSLPYRIWFAKHCDEIRVTVVKETTGNVQTSTSAEGGAQAEGKSASELTYLAPMHCLQTPSIHGVDKSTRY